MFENAGSKLKTCAKVGFWSGVVLSVFVGWNTIRFSIGVGVDDLLSAIIGLIMIAVGVFVSYLAILLLLAFGELVESASVTAFYERKIMEELREFKKNQVQKTATAVTPQRSESQETNKNSWYCSGCGAENKTWYGTCSKCGKRRDN